MIFDLPMTVAPLAVFVIGIIAAWICQRLIARHRVRVHDLTEARKAMTAHFDAMDRIIVQDAIPEKVKRSLMSVTNALDDRDLAMKMCEFITANQSRSAQNGGFESAIDKLRKERPEVMDDIETAMSSALLVFMLRWPETSEQFKQFAVSSMINERREATVFNKVAEIARANASLRRLPNDGIKSDGAYA